MVNENYLLNFLDDYDEGSLTEEILLEDGLLKKLKWSFCRSSVKLLHNDTLNDIIRLHCTRDVERILHSSRRNRVKTVKRILDDLPEKEKERLMNSREANSLAKSGLCRFGLGVAFGAITYTFLALVSAISMQVGLALLRPLGQVTMGATAVAFSAGAVKMHQARLVRREEIMDILGVNKFEEAIDIRSTANKTMRPLYEMYFHVPGDTILKQDNSSILVESMNGSITRMFAEEYVVKDIRSKLANLRYDTINVDSIAFLKENYLEEYGEPLTEDILTEGWLTDKIRWSIVKSTIRFLDDTTLDAILRHRYKHPEEKLKLPRKQKIREVKKIANELPDLDKDRLMHVTAVDDMAKLSAKQQGIGVGLGAFSVCATMLSIMTGNFLLAAIFSVATGPGALMLTGFGVKSAVKARTIHKSKIAAILSGKNDEDDDY